MPVDPHMALITANSESERVAALLKIVKQQWREEHERATRLQAEVDRMRPVVSAAEAYADQHGEFLRVIRAEYIACGLPAMSGNEPRFRVVETVDEYRKQSHERV